MTQGTALTGDTFEHGRHPTAGIAYGLPRLCEWLSGCCWYCNQVSVYAENPGGNLVRKKERVVFVLCVSCQWDVSSC
jgi:hypothetical protein